MDHQLVKNISGGDKSRDYDDEQGFVHREIMRGDQSKRRDAPRQTAKFINSATFKVSDQRIKQRLRQDDFAVPLDLPRENLEISKLMPKHY